MRTAYLKLISVLIILVLTSAVLYAQPEENDPPPPSDAPIDGGLSILIAAGVGYGAKKAIAAKRKRNEKL